VMMLELRLFPNYIWQPFLLFKMVIIGT